MARSRHVGDISGSWFPATRPARLAGDEIRAPATLVEAILYAIADVGSIPTVSTIGSTCKPWPRETGSGFALWASGLVEAGLVAFRPRGWPRLVSLCLAASTTYACWLSGSIFVLAKLGLSVVTLGVALVAF